MPDKLFNFQINVGHLIWILALVFAAGRMIQRIDQLETELSVVSERLAKKISVQNDIKDLVHAVDKRVVVLETTN